MITIGNLKKVIKEIEENYNFGDGCIHQSVDDVPVIISMITNDVNNPNIYSCDRLSHGFFVCPDNEMRICLSINNI